jgi:hypothetical protein
LSGVSRCYIGNYAAGMAVAAANLFPERDQEIRAAVLRGMVR